MSKKPKPQLTPKQMAARNALRRIRKGVRAIVEVGDEEKMIKAAVAVNNGIKTLKTKPK